MSGGRRASVAIPSQQYADQLAAALAEGDLLSHYYCGTPPRAELRAVIGDRFRFRPQERLGHALARRLVKPGPGFERQAYRFYASFDRRIARALARDPADAIIGYENCTLAMFEQARAAGRLTILDAADVHYRFQQAMGDSLGDPALQAQVNARKDREIALADYLLCCSEMAKASYVEAGVPAERIFVAGLGADLARFASGAPRPAAAGPLRMVFAGRFTVKKGADLLAEALERVRAQGLDFTLQVAADTGGGDPALVRRFEALGTLLGKLPQEQLPALFAASDLLLVPSRFDSYGMVVAEAMAGGTPALVSEHVGAKDLIRQGESGYIVPAGDAGALAAQLAAAAADPDAVRAMSAAAAHAGATADWSRYRSQVRANIREIFARRWA
ncbi:glycosyltransferase family 4 protein [Sphingomonas sp.]|uniref:glycosyltransferase family 4 protein n=1 Tax=Sphingomonas sp. TaxID=28214 RepID=UPI001B161077|nr:glycosyltransferase family 4 protein [Sphingomonas sp.]MBO9711491.1 glycosyltransferase family 4 protein [Sphingomonas sp.]